jgi:hypothetical protein
VSEALSVEDAEFLAYREAEDRAAQERLRAQKGRANLTPMPASPDGKWVVETTWADMPKPLTLIPWNEYKAAERDGMQMACCAGARAVRVAAPDGTVHCTWDREGNYWLHHTEWAEAIHRREHEEIVAGLRRRGKLP